VITLEYLSKISSVIREDLISTTLIRRNSVVRPLYIGYDGVSNYLNNKISGVYL
jgi:hypothetical protein